MKKRVCVGTGKHSGMGCGKERYIFSHGLCQECASRASYARNKPTSAVTYVKSKAKVKKSLFERVLKPTGEKKLFEQIWSEREHVSEVSGEKLLPLGHKFWVSQFAHVVSKGSHPEMRLNADNIILLTWEEHFMWDNHRHKLKDKPEWKRVFEKYEDLRTLK